MDTNVSEQIIQVIQKEEEFVSITNDKESLGHRCPSSRIIQPLSNLNCKGYIGVVYRSPSQDNITEYENFLSDFDELLSKTASSNSLFTIIL